MSKYNNWVNHSCNNEKCKWNIEIHFKTMLCLIYITEDVLLLSNIYRTLWWTQTSTSLKGLGPLESKTHKGTHKKTHTHWTDESLQKSCLNQRLFQRRKRYFIVRILFFRGVFNWAKTMWGIGCCWGWDGMVRVNWEFVPGHFWTLFYRWIPR